MPQQAQVEAQETRIPKFPENAYRELKPGEKFVPMIPPSMRVPELTPRMFIFGLLMNVIFSVAATFLALKAGQGIETIPISILAVGLSGFLLKTGRRASSILENMYALSISTTSSHVAGGTCHDAGDLHPEAELAGKPEHREPFALPADLARSVSGCDPGALFLIPFSATS